MYVRIEEHLCIRTFEDGYRFRSAVDGWKQLATACY